MKKLLPILMKALLVVACSEKLSPEEEAAQAALSYYNRLLEGFPDGLLASKADVDSLPDDYSGQLKKVYEQYVSDINEKHGGLCGVSISENIARRDSFQTKEGDWRQVVYAFLVLTFKDSVKEEISVPMVQRNGEWVMK